MVQTNKLLLSSPEAQGVSSSAILAFVNDVELKPGGIHSFMLLRHGQVLAKGWWEPYQETERHMLFSLSKSFTSTAVGLAVDEGLLNIDDFVLPFFEDDTPACVTEKLAAMRVRHLLTMTTGHAEDTTQHLRESEDNNWARAFLKQSVKFEPGTHFLYNSGASYMLSAIVQKLTGQTLQSYLTPRLFEPLGIRNPIWTSCPHGINAGGWGLSLITEDVARFGQLYLQKGEWLGRQLIPSQWVEQATSFQVPNAGSGMGDAVEDCDNDWAQGYGFQFWRCRNNVYRGDGAFGQYCIVMPEQDAVVVITSAVDVMQTVLDQVWNHLLPAMKDSPLVENADAAENLTSKLDSLNLSTPFGNSTSPLVSKIDGQVFRFEENELGLTKLSVQFSGENCTMTRWTGDRQTMTEATFSAWNRSNTFDNHLISSSAAAAGAWKKPNVYQMVVHLTETPFSITTTLRFEDGQLYLDEEVNVSFEETRQWQMIGRLATT